MNFRTVVAKTGGQAYGSVVPFGGPAAEALLSDLLGVQDAQLALLRTIERSVRRLADVPWESARMHFEDAAIHGRSPEHVRRSLERAADRLHDAIPSQPETSPRRADARLMLAIVFFILGDAPAARHHAEIAYVEARTAAWSIAHKLRWNFHPDKQQPKRSVEVGRWYDDVEWAAARIGDPEAASVELTAEGLPFQAVIDRSGKEHKDIRWREGAPLDFVYIAYGDFLRRRLPGLFMTSTFSSPVQTLTEFMAEPRKHGLHSPYIVSGWTPDLWPRAVN
jgi:hypothetical protein